jgi:hypothetical protein
MIWRDDVIAAKCPPIQGSGTERRRAPGLRAITRDRDGDQVERTVPRVRARREPAARSGHPASPWPRGAAWISATTAK